MNSEQTNEIAAALAKAQGAMENAKFNKVNPHFKSRYADLSAIIEAIKKPLADNGIGYSQTTIVGETSMMLVTKLLHASGQWIDSEYPLPLAPDKPQIMGSALTYARRYELAAICGISAEEDDDANAAEDAGARKPPKPAPDVIAEVKPAAPVFFSRPHGPIGKAVGTNGIDIEDEAREAASRGRAVFYAWYKKRSDDEKDRVDLIIEELKEMVEAVEAADQEEGS